jgi:hypothetical protein
MLSRLNAALSPPRQIGRDRDPAFAYATRTLDCAQPIALIYGATLSEDWLELWSENIDFELKRTVHVTPIRVVARMGNQFLLSPTGAGGNVDDS